MATNGTNGQKPKIPDEAILKMILAGSIVATTDGRIFRQQSSNGSRKYFCELTPEVCKWTTGDLRYRIKIGGESYKDDKGKRRMKQRAINRAKLVWMIHHKRLVPDGFDVDHADDDPSNDAPDNLQLLPSEENRAGGSRKAAARTVAGSDVPF